MKFFSAIVVVLALLLIGGFSKTPYSRAQEINCDAIVFDEAGVFKPDISAVEAEAQNLSALGVEVRVRTVNRTGSLGDDNALDKFEKTLEEGCNSWQATGGERKNNLVVVMVAVENRLTGLYYGEQWEKTLDKAFDGIIDDRMNPRFRDGDFAGGFVNGIKEVERVVNLQLNPPAPGSSDGGTTNNNFDFSGVGKVLGIIFAIILAIVLAFVGFAVFSRWSKSREDRRGAQQKARDVKNKSGSKVNEVLADLSQLEVLVTSIQSQVSEEDSKKLKEVFSNAQELSSQASAEFSGLEGSADPEASLTVAEYESIEENYSQVNSIAVRAIAAVNEAKSELRVLQEAVANAPKKVEEIPPLVAVANSAISRAKSQGFNCADLEKRVIEAQNKVSKAQTAFGDKRFTQGSQLVVEAEEILSAVTASAKDLPDQKAKVEKAIADLESRIEATKTSITAGKNVFDQIEADFPPESYRNVAGNGTESVKRVNTADSALTAAKTAVAMSVQDWAGAESQIASANKALDEADSYMRSITALKEHLIQAKVDAPGEIAAAEADIEQAVAFSKSNRADIQTDYSKEIGRASASLDLAKRQLSETKPNYLEVVRLAGLANAAADKVLEAERDEVEKTKAARRQVGQTLRDAKVSISQAREYIEDHDSDVDDSARRSLEKAVSAYNSAVNGNINGLNLAELLLILDLLQRSQNHATQAYSSAENDFTSAESSRQAAYERRRQAEERRQQAEERRSGSWDSDDDDGGGSSSSWGSLGGLGGGGGSSGWSLGGGGGGGSSGFGGGGGGGGSKGW